MSFTNCSEIMETSQTVGKLVNYAELDKISQELIEEAISVREAAYCPYSKFQVGSAVLTKDGNIHSGCNVENASFGLSICAERSALVKSVSAKEREITAIAVSGELHGGLLPPCGACREFILEFSKITNLPIQIYLSFPDKSKILETSIEELLPFAFKAFKK